MSSMGDGIDAEQFVFKKSNPIIEIARTIHNDDADVNDTYTYELRLKEKFYFACIWYSQNLKTSVDTVKGDLTEAVDKYLSYCAEEWTKENELAIERGLRSEMTEGFIDGLKTLFTEHYVEVPEDKYNVIDELANRLDEMEQKLDGEVTRNMDITEELDTLKRSNVVREAGNDLSESQKEKLESLSNGVDFKDVEDFQEKVVEIKEAYFPSDVDSIVEETLVMEGEGTYEDESSEPVLDPTIARYSSAISKLKPLG